KEVGSAETSVGRLTKPDLEYSQWTGSPGFDGGKNYRARVCASGGLLDIRGCVEAGDECHSLGRGQGCRGGSNGPAAASSHRRSVLHGASSFRGPIRLRSTDALAGHACLWRLGRLDCGGPRLYEGQG